MSARFICVGTHHKTGTIWMRRVWRRISHTQKIPFMQCYRAEALANAAKTGPQIIVNWSSVFPPELMAMDHARFLHLIRDPRDVLLSGMRYHRIAPLHKEKFLRQIRPEWGGKTYQEHMNALPDDSARLMFEMMHKHAHTVAEMRAWPYGHPHAVELRYEDLIEDRDCAIMRRALERLAIEGLDIDGAVQSYWERSLFGGLAKQEDRSDRQNLHISSGAPTQWRTKLAREIAEVYADRFGDDLIALGYAKDQSWVAECRPRAEIAA